MAKILLIGGSLNQTTMMHAIGSVLADRHECFYTPFYDDGPLRLLKPLGLLDHTILAGRFRATTENYLRQHGLPVDDGGRERDYDLVVTCSDLVLPRNVRGKPIVLVQEGMTDPENWAFHLVKNLRLPLWLASTSTTGLSGAYRKFCVASPGYRRYFIAKGVAPARLEVTGIPNFDDCARHRENDFPYRGFVLVATSDTRETFKRDDRASFIRSAVDIAAGRPLLFKLHPNEDWDRSTREIRRSAPGALVFIEGNTNHMIANCDVLVTQYSSCVFVGLALGKECHSYFDVEGLRQLLPVQNGGRSARNIAGVCERVLGREAVRERRTA